MKVIKSLLPSEAVSEASVKQYLRIPEDVPADDLEIMIAAAVQYCENITGRALGKYAVTVEGSADEMTKLPLVPVYEVNSVTVDGIETDDYTVNECGIDIHVPGKSVSVEYVAGYDEIPAQITQAILLLCGHWYDNRTSVMIGQTSAKVEMTTDLLLRAYKVWWY